MIIYNIEFSKIVHSKVIIIHEIKDPKLIEIKHLCMFKFVKPEIILPDQTPVSGSGIAINEVSNIYLKISNFFSDILCISLSYFKLSLDINLSKINPVVLSFKNLIKIIIK